MRNLMVVHGWCVWAPERVSERVFLNGWLGKTCMMRVLDVRDACWRAESAKLLAGGWRWGAEGAKLLAGGCDGAEGARLSMGD